MSNTYNWIIAFLFVAFLLNLLTYTNKTNELTEDSEKKSGDTCQYLLETGSWHDFIWYYLPTVKFNNLRQFRQTVVKRLKEPGFWAYSGKFYTSNCDYYWYTPKEIKTCLFIEDDSSNSWLIRW